MAPAATARWASSTATLVPSPVIPATIATWSPTLVDQGFDDLDLLGLGQEGAFPGVPEDDQDLTPVDRGQELAQVGQRGVVHVAVDR